MFSKFPIISRVFLWLVVPFIALAVMIIYQTYASLVPSSNEIKLATGEVIGSISRDENGVAYVTSQTDVGAYFSLGYAHAQDRLWQLEVQKRIASGRLSEVFGEESVSTDTWMRTLGLYANADAILRNNNLSDGELAALEAYADGINTWVQNVDVLPPEFYLFDVEPSHWQARDSLAWMKVFQLNLAGNMWDELNAALLSNVLSEAQFSSFYNVSESAPQIAMPNLEFAEFELAIRKELGIGRQFAGSNGWAVSGQYTESGKPMLVNDPHLALQAPSLFYAAKIQGDLLSAQGMSLVGLPFIVFGKNKDIAWGGTSMEADVQDLYVETIHPTEPNTYLYDGQWQKMSVKTELIQIAKPFPQLLNEKPKPKKITVRTTNKGPVISDVIQTSQSGVISLAWVGLDKNDRSFSAFYKLGYARNWQEFESAFEDYVAPALNMFYADDENIGLLGVGKLPVRRSNSGQFMQAGWLANAWQEMVPIGNMPKVYAPTSGLVVNANNKVMTRHADYYISSNFALNDRHDRITQLLNQQIEKNEKLSPAAMAQILKDTQSYESVAAKKLISPLACDSKLSCAAKQVLLDWDGDYSSESIGAAIFHEYLQQLKTHVIADVIELNWTDNRRQEMIDSAVSSMSYQALIRILEQDASLWCTADVQCKKKQQAAWDETITRLSKILGPDVKDWQWGSINLLQYMHNPLSFLDWANPLFGTELAGQGANNTINVSQSVEDKEDGYHKLHGAVFRQIMSVGSEQDEHQFILVPGQSGHLLSPNYRDAAEAFSQGKLWTFCMAEPQGHVCQ